MCVQYLQFCVLFVCMWKLSYMSLISMYSRWTPVLDLHFKNCMENLWLVYVFVLYMCVLSAVKEIMCGVVDVHA